MRNNRGALQPLSSFDQKKEQSTISHSRVIKGLQISTATSWHGNKWLRLEAHFDVTIFPLQLAC